MAEYFTWRKPTQPGGKTVFVYRPRGGAYTIRVNVLPQMVYCAAEIGEWIAGDIVELSWCAAEKGRWWRAMARRAADEIVEAVGGLAADIQGTIMLAVPREWAVAVWQKMELLKPPSDEQQPDIDSNVRTLYKHELVRFDEGLRIVPVYGHNMPRFSTTGYAHYMDGGWAGYDFAPEPKYTTGRITIKEAAGCPQFGVVDINNSDIWYEVWGRFKVKDKKLVPRIHRFGPCQMAVAYDCEYIE